MPKLSRTVLVAAACASALAAAACASSAPPPALSSDLAGTSWTAKAIDGRDVSGSAPRLVFAAEDRVRGRAGCNSFNGIYEARNGRIDVRALGRTEMACAGPVMTQEDAFLGVLGDASVYRRENQELVITAQDGRSMVLELAQG